MYKGMTFLLPLMVLITSAFSSSHAAMSEQEFTRCEIPLVDIDVASRLISLFNSQKITCSNPKKFISVNGKAIAGVTNNEMASIIRMTVLSCQEMTTRYPSPPVENGCVHRLRKDINYFLATTRTSNVKVYPNPFAVALRHSRVMGPYIDFELWANRALYGRY